MPDGQACAEELSAAMAPAPTATQVKLLEILGQLNNTKSLAALAAAAKSGEGELQDAATRLLGETMTLDAGPVLLDLAQTLPDGKFKIRAIRGYIRLVRQFNMPETQRVEMCALALKAAGRPDEQRMVLKVAERYPSLKMLYVAAQATRIPELKADAVGAARVIAHQLGGSPAEARKLLAQVDLKPLKIEIVKAQYGAGDQWKDVTKMLQARVGGLPTIPLSSPKYNQAFGGDPAPGVVKELKIQYRIDDRASQVTFPENAPVLLPMPR
jgi:hypothetical protein